MMRFVATLLWLFLVTNVSAAEFDPLGVQGALGLLAPNAAPATANQPIVPPMVRPPGANDFNYNSNLNSDVFGMQLFSGAFAQQGSTLFNPDYLIAIGDSLRIRFWGAFDFDATVIVDAQGNIFLPHVGPVRISDVRNQDLQATIEEAVRRVYRANVFSYASLASAQPVRVFVGGFVHRPGLYNGTSMDSLLHYLDLAGGIDPERGSFLSVQVKRGDVVRTTIDLYDFLINGKMPMVQFADGDVIFVNPRQAVVKVGGLVDNAKRFEFSTTGLTVGQLALLAKPKAGATHVRILRNTGIVKNIDYYPILDAESVTLSSGDDVEFTADKKLGNITVRVEGEHLSAQEYVLPYGTKLGELLAKIEFSKNSDQESLQLFRQSVRERQRRMLETSLRSLETSVLTARSGTSDEARLRKEEAELIMQWVDRAKKVEPTGQVMVAQASGRDQLLLENGDLLRIPSRDGLVLVNGEVLFPNAIAYDDDLRIDDYIERAGGYTQNANVSRVVVAHRDGSFDQAGSGFFQQHPEIRQGDEILVLPKIDVKSRQVFKDLTQILYQIAISTKVILSL